MCTRRDFLSQLAVQLPPRRWPPTVYHLALPANWLNRLPPQNLLQALTRQFWNDAQRAAQEQQVNLDDHVILIALVPRSQVRS